MSTKKHTMIRDGNFVLFSILNGPSFCFCMVNFENYMHTFLKNINYLFEIPYSYYLYSDISNIKNLLKLLVFLNM